MRPVIQTPAFRRDLKSWLKSHPNTSAAILAVLEQLAIDPSIPALHTHKLKGKLAGYWACSVGYDLRIVFDYASLNGAEAIVLHALGSHDDVY